jgi:hypothetical protein
MVDNTVRDKLRVKPHKSTKFQEVIQEFEW